MCPWRGFPREPLLPEWRQIKDTFLHCQLEPPQHWAMMETLGGCCFPLSRNPCRRAKWPLVEENLNTGYNNGDLDFTQFNDNEISPWKPWKPWISVHINRMFKNSRALNIKLGQKYLFFLKFINFWERESGGGAEQAEDGGSEAGSALTAESLMWGWNSRTMRSWPEPKSELNRLSHPGAPF